MSNEIGRVIWFDRKKGFGFVKIVDPSSELHNTDVFVHFSSIRCKSPFKMLYPGECVSMDVEKNENVGEDNKKYSTNNITGIYGCDLMVDNEKYIIKVIRKRNEADGDGVEDTEGVHENEGEFSLDSNVTDKN